MSQASALKDDLSQLQARLKHNFNDVRLLQRAVTHRSFASDHNERLEFLGDSVLNLAVAHLLFAQLSNLPEGDLSRVRANLVKQETLHQLALSLEIPPCLKLGEGELKSGGQRRPSILADALEAIIGAVFLDAGYEAAEKLVHGLFTNVEITPQMQAAAKDPKTELQEWLQGRKLQLPQYSVVSTSGAAHRQIFDVACDIPELSLSQHGSGPSRRAGEQAAAAAMLEILKVKARG
ncbi:MAG: Ribonuclease 3 [Pseudomonadota bacterium]|jgi:ribonuclease-3